MTIAPESSSEHAASASRNAAAAAPASSPAAGRAFRLCTASHPGFALVGPSDRLFETALRSASAVNSCLKARTIQVQCRCAAHASSRVWVNFRVRWFCLCRGFQFC